METRRSGLESWNGSWRWLVGPSGLKKKIILASSGKTQRCCTIFEGYHGRPGWRCHGARVAANEKMERRKSNITICFRISPVLDFYLFLPLSCVCSQFSVFGVTRAMLNRSRTAIRVDLGSFLHQDGIKESDDDLELSRAAQQVQGVDMGPNKNKRWTCRAVRCPPSFN